TPRPRRRSSWCRRSSIRRSSSRSRRKRWCDRDAGSGVMHDGCAARECARARGEAAGVAASWAGAGSCMKGMTRRSSMRKRLAGLVFAFTLWSAGGAAAQVAWASPMLLPPQPPTGFGLYLMEAAFGDLGVMATWRGTRSVGFRFGIAEQNFDDDIAIFGGVDFSGTLTRASRSEERRVGKEGRARLATND